MRVILKATNDNYNDDEMLLVFELVEDSVSLCVYNTRSGPDLGEEDETRKVGDKIWINKEKLKPLCRLLQ